MAAALVYRAIGSRFHPFLIDAGLLRKDEAEEVLERLNTHLPGINLRVVDASGEFCTALKGRRHQSARRGRQRGTLHGVEG